MRKLAFSICAGIAALAAAGLRAQDQPMGPPPPPPPGADQGGTEGWDQQAGRPEVWVLSKIHEINQMEVRMGHLAMDRGTFRGVREFGRRLVEDHRRSDERLTRLAQDKGIDLIHPRAWNDFQRRADEDARRAADELQDAHGEHFDHLFARDMYEAHDAAIHILERSEDRIQDPEIRRFVDRTLDMMREHRRIAQDLMQRQGMQPNPPGP